MQFEKGPDYKRKWIPKEFYPKQFPLKPKKGSFLSKRRPRNINYRNKIRTLERAVEALIWSNNELRFRIEKLEKREKR